MISYLNELQSRLFVHADCGAETGVTFKVDTAITSDFSITHEINKDDLNMDKTPKLKINLNPLPFTT